MLYGFFLILGKIQNRRNLRNISMVSTLKKRYIYLSDNKNPVLIKNKWIREKLEKGNLSMGKNRGIYDYLLLTFGVILTAIAIVFLFIQIN